MGSRASFDRLIDRTLPKFFQADGQQRLRYRACIQRYGDPARGGFLTVIKAVNMVVIVGDMIRNKLAPLATQALACCTYSVFASLVAVGVVSSRVD